MSGNIGVLDFGWQRRAMSKEVKKKNREIQNNILWTEQGGRSSQDMLAIVFGRYSDDLGKESPL